MAISNGISSAIQKVLVLGDNRLATSIIAGLSDNKLEIHLSTHSQSVLEAAAGVTVHKIDASPESLKSLFSSVQPDVIFSTISGGSFDHQKEIIDCAIESKVFRFVPCEWGQDSLNEQVQGRLPPHQGKAHTIAYLREKSDNNAFTWVAVATGCSLEYSLISGNIGFDIEWQSATLHETGTEFAASSTSWPGRVASAIIDHWEALENQYIYVPGLVTNANSILKAFREQTKQEWASGHVDIEDTIHEAERRLERGFPDASMFLMERSVLFDKSLNAVQPFLEHDAKGKLGLKTEALEPIVKRVLHDFKHHGKGGCGCD